MKTFRAAPSQTPGPDGRACAYRYIVTVLPPPVNAGLSHRAKSAAEAFPSSRPYDGTRSESRSFCAPLSPYGRFPLTTRDLKLPPRTSLAGTTTTKAAGSVSDSSAFSRGISEGFTATMRMFRPVPAHIPVPSIWVTARWKVAMRGSATSWGGLLLTLSIRQVFSLRPGRAAQLVYRACFLAPAAGALVLPYGIAVPAIYLVLVSFILSFVQAVRSGQARGDPYRILFLASLILFTLSGTVTKSLYEGELYLPAVTPDLFLIFSQCVLLSRDYALARTEAETLNANLERMVEERTRQLRAANAQLADSQAALRDTIRNISHDLKPPLTVLNNYLELLEDDSLALGEPERTEYLGIAYRKNLDLQRLINDLFVVTRMESGGVEYRLDWTGAAGLAEEAAEKYASQARAKGVRFTAQAGPGLELYVDRDKIWTILDDLVYNALRYTPAGGSVALTLDLQGPDRACLRVADTGAGIPPEHLGRIFERFYKASQERGARDGSSGLGLYIVKTVAEAMGGAAAVESTLGVGTLFTLLFRGRAAPG